MRLQLWLIYSIKVHFVLLSSDSLMIRAYKHIYCLFYEQILAFIVECIEYCIILNAFSGQYSKVLFYLLLYCIRCTLFDNSILVYVVASC